MDGSEKKQKIGRNNPCPCGSGKKFKKCHGGDAKPQLEVHTGPPPEAVRKMLEKEKAFELQRQQEQGLGKAIISTVCNGWRFVAVGSEIYHSQKWKTFHDFLGDYIKSLLGGEWADLELKKPQAERHPLLTWYELTARYTHEFIKERGKAHMAPMTGAVSAYLGLAYYLYLTAHNVKVQQVLLKRLKNKEQFYGAYYETLVTGALIKAGFEIEFEDESDSSTSHCELTATYTKTGKKFSVEAKTRGMNKASADVGHQLYAALKKNAKHTRIIFIETNMPDDCDDKKARQILGEVVQSIRAGEKRIKIDGQPAPAAYVIATNNPHQYNLQNASQSSVVAEGFKIPDFKMDSQFATLRQALDAREKHIEMFSLMKSLTEHYRIPSTFDGEIPELVFGKAESRLIIGNNYAVPDERGKEVIGELRHAVVFEKEKLIHGIYKLADGREIFVSHPMIDDELTAYQKHPDTFFGVYKPHTKGIHDPLDLYDFLLDWHGGTSKEVLSGSMQKSPDHDKLRQQTRKELENYCESLVYSIMRSSSSPKPQKSASTVPSA